MSESSRRCRCEVQPSSLLLADSCSLGLSQSANSLANDLTPVLLPAYSQAAASAELTWGCAACSEQFISCAQQDPSRRVKFVLYRTSARGIGELSSLLMTLECQVHSKHGQDPAKQLTHRLFMLFCMMPSARPKFYRHEDLTAHDIPYYR